MAWKDGKSKKSKEKGHIRKRKEEREENHAYFAPPFPKDLFLLKLRSSEAIP